MGGWVGGRVDWVDGCLLEWVEYVAPGSGELEVFPECHVTFEDFSTAGCTGSRQVLKGPSGVSDHSLLASAGSSFLLGSSVEEPCLS